MEFVKWMVQDILSDSITWMAIIAIAVFWTWGTIDYILEKRRAFK